MGALLEENRLPLGRALRPSEEQLLIREMILQLKRGYLDVSYFEQKFSTNILQRWSAVWAQYAEDGLLSHTESRIELTRQGLLRVDALLPAFFAEEHQGIRYT